MALTGTAPSLGVHREPRALYQLQIKLHILVFAFSFKVFKKLNPGSQQVCQCQLHARPCFHTPTPGVPWGNCPWWPRLGEPSFLRDAPQHVLDRVGKGSEPNDDKQVRQGTAQESMVSVGLLQPCQVGASPRRMPVEKWHPILTVV